MCKLQDIYVDKYKVLYYYKITNGDMQMHKSNGRRRAFVRFIWEQK